MKLNYFNIQRFCIFDGPGIRTTLFLKGCPLSCIWCHNPESQKPYPQLMFSTEKCIGCGACVLVCEARSFDKQNKKALVDREKCIARGKCDAVCPNGANSICGKSGEIDGLFSILIRDKHFYETSGGGVTISGGEPASQAEEVLKLIEKLKENDIDTAVETCGIGTGDFYKKAYKLGALFLYDIKGIDNEKHIANTGVSNKKIISNLDMLIEEGADIIVRIPLIPDYNDSDDDLTLLCDFLKERKDRIRYAEIMPYHRLGVHKREELDVLNTVKCDNASEEQKARWKTTLEKSGAEIKISGN